MPLESRRHLQNDERLKIEDWLSHIHTHKRKKDGLAIVMLLNYMFDDDDDDETDMTC